MNRLYFNTETTGLIPRGETDPLKMPRIVQMAMLYVNNDMDDIMHFNAIVKPDNFIVAGPAAAIHGITTEIAHQFGLPLITVMSFASMLIERADIIIAHNMAYDLPVFNGEITRLGKRNRMQDKLKFCTMKAATPFVAIPSTFKKGEFKWPTLQEAHEHFLGCKFDGAHDALADVRACHRIHTELINHGAADCT